MSRRLRKLITDQEAAFLEQLIVSDDHVASKNALQQLCKQYRSGHKLRNEPRMRRILLGSLDHRDKKVVRWALNSLAFIAISEDVAPILRTIAANRIDPDVLGAGVAALASLRDLEKLREELASIDLPLQGAALFAAAQQLQGLEPDLRKERVDIDTSDYGDLRLATVLVGVNKAPENLFEPGHKNSVILGKLNHHPDDLTAQYSIWALTERDDLGLKDLEIAVEDITGQRENVRAYIYQLVAEDADFSRREIDLIRQGIDDETEVRDHLARGLRNTYFAGLPDITLTWYLNESDDKTRRRILDHIATHSDVDDSYFEFARELIRSSNLADLDRAQIEASASKKLELEVRRFKFQSYALDLHGGIFVTENKFEIGSIQAGAVAFNGNATVKGDANISVQQAADNARLVSQSLLAAANEAGSDVPEEVKSALAESVTSPTKGRLSTILSWLKGGARIGGAALAAIGGVPGAIEAVELALPLLPD